MPSVSKSKTNINSIDLSGRNAIVTGGAQGIGKDVAERLRNSGAKVALWDLDAEELRRTASALDAHAELVDQTDWTAVQRAAKNTLASFGTIDILVNNAGIYEFGALEQITPEHFHKQFDTNVLGLLLVTQAAVARFNPAGGSIINIGSVVGKMAAPGGAVYSATKGAVDSVTVALSKELGAKKIRVNALNPGVVETEGTHAAGLIGSEFDTGVATATPLGRIGQPSDIATAAAFLASTDAGWINGQTIYAAGGYTR